MIKGIIIGTICASAGLCFIMTATITLAKTIIENNIEKRRRC